MVTCRVYGSISEIGKDAWDGLEGTAQPFVGYNYLHALETSGAVGPGTGWLPAYIGAKNDESGRLEGALPAFVKHHSMGEYVFDFSWADAYRRMGKSYYPKLIIAIPFTPVSSPKLLLQRGSDSAAIARALLDFVEQWSRQEGWSSSHALFLKPADLEIFQAQDYLTRIDYHYEWRNPGYRDFDDLLADLTSRQRKKIKRERKRMVEQELEIRVFDGHSLPITLQPWLYRFYAESSLLRGQQPYLNAEFFHTILQSMPESLLIFTAFHNQKPVAMAICYYKQTILYGRHWGCADYFDALHFELCYYCPLEWAIKNGVALFDPGVQGEHKKARGFFPVLRYSAHRLWNPTLHQAVARYLEEERSLIRVFHRQMMQQLPYREQARIMDTMND